MIEELVKKHKSICPISCSMSIFLKQANIIGDEDNFIIYRNSYQYIEITLMVAKGRSIAKLIKEFKQIVLKEDKPVLFLAKDNKYIRNHSYRIGKHDEELQLYRLML